MDQRCKRCCLPRVSVHGASNHVSYSSTKRIGRRAETETTFAQFCTSGHPTCEYQETVCPPIPSRGCTDFLYLRASPICQPQLWGCFRPQRVLQMVSFPLQTHRSWSCESFTGAGSGSSAPRRGELWSSGWSERESFTASWLRLRSLRLLPTHQQHGGSYTLLLRGLRAGSEQTWTISRIWGLETGIQWALYLAGFGIGRPAPPGRRKCVEYERRVWSSRACEL